MNFTNIRFILQSLRRKDAMRSKRNRQAFAFSENEHEKINILIDKTHGQDPPAEPRQGSMDKLQDMRKMVSEVTGIMKDNIEKVVEREEKLNTLEVRTEELQASSQSFKITSTHVVHKYRSRHRRLICVLVVIIVIILFLVGGAFFLYVSGVFSQSTQAPPTTSPPNNQLRSQIKNASTS